ncbi:hypothetical protein [Streptomyces decoyicus]|uniref:hypothetical protein n=1 Tax=Streptomyces decoyicus TaxID=249567 RepID=UPI002F90A1B0
MTILMDRPVRTERTAISPRDLTPQQQDGWNRLEAATYDLEQAAKAGANIAAELVLTHATAAHFLGIDLPVGDTLVQCSCEDCDCEDITAASLCSEDHSGYGAVIQCGTCTDEHRSLGD